ncbi:LysR family transcriptional regulator [Chitinimonas lacunae]|uniref:LysR family transcriptional regulator n=1 Tax=Chitinimonas lacunae TaxID=1963018 RepID=A0ABV8MPP3_9NEIS
MDKIEQMRALVEAVRCGGLAAAGRKLGLSRSQVSKQILDLEARLGARLLQRNQRSLAPTEAGAAYLERALDVLALVEEAEATVASLQAEPAGLLRINAPMSFGTIRLAPLLPQFRLRHPRTELSVRLDDRHLDPLEHGFDVTVRVTAPTDVNLAARKLCEVRRILCASPAYLAARGEPARPADLREHDCLPYALAPFGLQWTFRRDGVDEAVTVSGPFSANNGETLREAALAGLGVAMLPDFLVEREIAAGRLQALLPAWSPPGIAAYALYVPDRRLPRKTRAFIDFLVEKLGEASPG